MKLKPIKNDRELNRAVKRIDELWGARLSGRLPHEDGRHSFP